MDITTLIAVVRHGVPRSSWESSQVLTDLILEAGGSLKLEDGNILVQIKEKDTTRRGTFTPGEVLTGRYALLKKSKIVRTYGDGEVVTSTKSTITSIELFGSTATEHRVKYDLFASYSRTFKLGDLAISYNPCDRAMRPYENRPIHTITEKTVIIGSKHLSMVQFDLYNANTMFGRNTMV